MAVHKPTNPLLRNAIIAVALCGPSVAVAQPSQGQGPAPQVTIIRAHSNVWGVRSTLLQPVADESIEAGVALDVRLGRGASFSQISLGFTTDTSGDDGTLRLETTFNRYILGGVYAGAGGGIGMLSVGRWSGTAMTLHGQLGLDLNRGAPGRRVFADLRVGHTLPIADGSASRTVGIPRPAAATRMEIAVALGVSW